jgi:AGZA family xanthine/uracil permease-like MFS transporter
VCLTGTLGWIAWAVPIEAGIAIVLWIGVVITAQAFAATPRAQAPAVVLGLLPGVAAWGAGMAKHGLRAAGLGAPQRPFDGSILAAFDGAGIAIAGAFALEQGFIFTAMILAAATVAIIERRFRTAAAWCWVAAGLSASGIMHGWAFTAADSVLALGPAWPWVAGWAAMGACLWLAPWVTVPDPDGPPPGDA